jgi:hypothetical protein
MFVYAYGVANADDVKFATWSDDGGQNDIIFYDLAGGHVINQTGGTWRASIPLASHPGLGVINVHAYPNNAAYGNSPTPCAASFNRLNAGTIYVDSGITPSTWTIACALTGPACPDILPGANSTNGIYPTKPYSTWTITPANKAGYDWKVNACPINVPCAGTFGP